MAQGVVTGIRGLCNGLGPALFGFIFYLFDVNLNENISPTSVPKTMGHIHPSSKVVMTTIVSKSMENTTSLQVGTSSRLFMRLSNMIAFPFGILIYDCVGLIL